jgi:Rad3-related DNA helicase
MVSREFERECVVVFDEAHNIDNVCIEALSGGWLAGRAWHPHPGCGAGVPLLAVWEARGATCMPPV